MSHRRGDPELAAVMRKLLLQPGPDGYTAVDNMNGTLDVDCTGIPLTEDEQQAIEEVWAE